MPCVDKWNTTINNIITRRVIFTSIAVDKLAQIYQWYMASFLIKHFDKTGFDKLVQLLELLLTDRNYILNL